MARKKKKNGLKINVRNLGLERALGQCFQGENLIELDERQTSYMFGRVAVHEATHAVAPTWSESRVEKASTIIWDVIWALNYRRVYPDNIPMKPRIKKKKKAE